MSTPFATGFDRAQLVKNRLFVDCYRRMRSEQLVLPTIPDVSLKIRRAINDPYASSGKIARVIQADPSITARLIKIANSPMYQSRRTIESCPEALTRIGLKATQDIVTALAMKAVFNAKTALIKKRMAELWIHSSHVAAISAVLAHKTPGFDPDRAMLAGLIHDIGVVPILTYADQHPQIGDNPAELPEAIQALRIPIGIRIVKTWSFPSDFETVVAHAENWLHDEQTDADYSDIVMIAQLHSYIGKVDIRKIPPIDTLPAYKKLAAGRLDADMSLSILDQAKDEIEQLRQLLG